MGLMMFSTTEFRALLSFADDKAVLLEECFSKLRFKEGKLIGYGYLSFLVKA
jgi:hypothetical protein